MIPKFLSLHNKNLLPLKGLGTATSKNLKIVIPEAISLGYRSIDTAKSYGNEPVIGSILSSLYEKNVIKREELFLSTKIKNVKNIDVEKEVLNSLKNFQTEYLDMVLVHWPVGKVENGRPVQTPLHSFWSQLESCVKKGCIRSIGLSNFNTQLICDLLSYAEIKPAVNQIETHPYNTNERLIAFCKQNDIQIIAYAPLCRGGANVKNSLGRIIDAFNEPILKKIGDKYGKTVGQVILNWNLCRNVAIIPKTEKVERLKENFESDSFQLNEEEVKEISGLNQNIRTIDPLDKNEFMRNSFQGLPIFD